MVKETQKMIRDTYVNYVTAPDEGLIGEEFSCGHDAMIAINDHIFGRIVV